MIEFASEKYRNGIIKLWQEAFGDDEEFICDFLEKIDYKKNLLVFLDNGEVVSMATILPVFCKSVKGRYVYAVATAKSHRGKGLCKAVMNRIDEVIKSQGEGFAILVPASESLFSFYEKLGYYDTIYKPSFSEVNGIGKQCSVSEYFKIRNEIFSDYDLIGWSEEMLEYILSFGEMNFCDGGAVYREETTLKELLTDEIFKSSWTEPFALIKYIDENLKFEKPYFGLCMN